MQRNDNRDKKALSPRQVASIFTDRIRSQPQIAEQYDVSQSLVSLIRSGKRWGRLTAELPLYRRIDYRHTRSGRRLLTDPQVRDIFTSSLDKRILIDAYRINRRTVERIQRGEFHNTVTCNLTRSTERLI